MRGHGAALATVVAVGFVAANAVAVLATVAWVSSGTGLYTTGDLARTTVTTILVATLLGSVTAGLVARRLVRLATPARVSAGAGAAAYAVATGLLFTFGGALATGVVVLIAGPAVAAVTSLLVVRHPR